MTTSTTAETPAALDILAATKADLLALDLGLYTDSLTKTAARFDDDADADDVVGAWLADGWIEQVRDLSEESVRDQDATSDRFELASGDFEAIDAILEEAGVEEDSEAWGTWRTRCERAAGKAWRAHWATGVEAIEAGKAHGIEHADDLANPAHTGVEDEGDSIIETLRQCARDENDWGNSSAEAWGLIDAEEKFGEAWKLAYCEAYEKAARERCAELADKMEEAEEDKLLDDDTVVEISYSNHAFHYDEAGKSVLDQEMADGFGRWLAGRLDEAFGGDHRVNMIPDARVRPLAEQLAGLDLGDDDLAQYEHTIDRAFDRWAGEGSPV